MSELEILQHKGKPPFFRAPPIRLKQLSAFLSIDAVQKKPEIGKFIELLITTASTEPGCVIDSLQLAEQLEDNGEKSSKQVIEKRVRQLKALGLLRKISCKRTRTDDTGTQIALGHVCALYDVNAPIQQQSDDPVFVEDHRHRRLELEQKKREIASDEKVLSLHQLRTNYVKSEGLFAGYTDRVLRTNQSDPRQSITAKFVYKQTDIVTITSDTETRGSLMTLQDLAVVRAFITTADQIINQDIFGYADPHDPTRPTNLFIIDIVDICTLLKKKGVGSSRDTVRKAIERIAASSFTITCDPNAEFSQSILDGKYQEKLSFFSRFGAYAENNYAKIRKPRFYQISFNSLTWSAIVSKKEHRRIFTTNPRVCHVRSGLIQSLWNICRMYKLPYFQGSSEGQSNTASRDWPLSLFESFFFPNYGPFLKDLKAHLEPFAIDKGKWKPGVGRGTSVALVLGFYVTVYWKQSTREHRIALAADKQDDYVGENRLRRQASLSAI